MIPPLVMQNTDSPQTAIIWMHGLGSSAHEYQDFIQAFDIPGGVKLILPSSPIQSVTLNDGMMMPAWFDIIELHPDAPLDELGIRYANGYIHALIDNEQAQGFSPEQIIIGGFSQGGALALAASISYQSRLLGAIGFSCYLGNMHKPPIRAYRESTPLLLCHGEHDTMVDVAFSKQTQAYLEKHAIPAEWHSFPMDHEICQAEVDVMNRWIRERLASKS